MSNKSLTSEERREVERTLNSPIADADLEFYSKAAWWTYEEAAALSYIECHKEPRQKQTRCHSVGEA